MRTQTNLDTLQLGFDEKEILSLCDSAKSKAFAISYASDHVAINVNTDKLLKDDVERIQKIFNYFLVNKNTVKNSIKIRLTKTFPAVDAFEFDGTACSAASISEFENKLFSDFHLLSSSVMMLGFFSAMSANNITIDEDDLIDALNKEILIVDQDWKTDQELSSIHLALDYLIENFNYIFNITRDYSVFEKCLPNLVRALMNARCIEKLLKLNNHQRFIATLDGRPHYFLHNAMEVDSLEAFELFLHCIGQEKRKLYDRGGNSFLHYCRTEKMLNRALEFPINIDQVNSSGHTALDIAGQNGHINKVIFLLEHGANPNIKDTDGDTFLTRPPASEKLNCVDLYKLYRNGGLVLKNLPKIRLQQGPNCGFYAIDCAVQYYYLYRRKLFKSQPPPARKREQSKADSSLREIRKKIGMGGRGAIFSCTAIAKIIDKTECRAAINHIKDYQHFKQIVIDALSQDAPLIIPFANQFKKGLLQGAPKAEHAHWATIIGWRVDPTDSKEKILLAQFGKYKEVLAEDLFNACCNIEVHYPQQYLFKRKNSVNDKKADWSYTNQYAPEAGDINSDVIYPRDLNIDFRGQLITVLPPIENNLIEANGVGLVPKK